MTIAKNQQTEHMSVSKKTISDTLTSIRKNGAKVQTLFELLENDDGFYDTEQFVKIALGGRNYNGIDGLDTQYQSFCEAYTIRLLEKYVRPQQKLYLLLAAFGFLPNYRNLSVKERYENYVKEKPNMRFKKGTKVVSELKWPGSSLQDIEEEEIDKVAAQLEKDIIKNGGSLGFASAILDELAGKFPEGLPEELPADFLKRIRMEPFSDKNPLQDETSEDDKIEHTRQVPNIPMQSRLQTWRSILKTRKGIITALAVVSIISVIVVIILARYITALGDSDPPIGKLFIRSPEGTEESEYNFRLDVGKGTIINIYGMPDDADIEDLEIWLRPEDTDLIKVEPIPADTPQVLPLLIRAPGIRIGEVENWEDKSKTNIVTIVVIYKKATPVWMNVEVVPDLEGRFSTELLENGGED